MRLFLTGVSLILSHLCLGQIHDVKFQCFLFIAHLRPCGRFVLATWAIEKIPY